MTPQDLLYCGKFNHILTGSNPIDGKIAVVLKDAAHRCEHLFTVPGSLWEDATKDEQARCLIDVLKNNGREINSSKFWDNFTIQLGFN